MKKPLIFLTNDDGIDSPGLKALAESVEPLGELLVVAPTHQQTAMGRSLLADPDVVLKPVDFPVNGSSVRAYCCDSSPAMAVTHALHVLCGGQQPRLLISGINYGENLGSNTTISGTIGAALEAACAGIPAMAVSMQTQIANHRVYADIEWDAAKHFARFFASRMLVISLPADVDLLKIDVPMAANNETQWRVTRQSRQPYFVAEFDNAGPKTKVGEGRVVRNIDMESLESDSDVSTLIRDQVVSVTPLSIDLTSRVDLDKLAGELGVFEENV